MELWLFQGTFNPVHNAHIRIAEYVLANTDAKKIIFIPAYLPPHKNTCDTEFIHRYNMLKLATNYNKNFEVSDIEYRLKGLSYTLLTIQELYKEYKNLSKINFIIGTDAFKNIKNWYKSDKLKELVYFKVFSRDNEININEYEELRILGYRFDIMKLDFEDISSTDIREKCKKSEPVTSLMPKEVEEYIEKNALYKTK